MIAFADLARLHTEATPGPWAIHEMDALFVGRPKPGRADLATIVHSTEPLGELIPESAAVMRANAALITAARNAVPDFLRIREETLALHAEFKGSVYSECVECEVLYPCPTVRIWNGESE